MELRNFVLAAFQIPMCFLASRALNLWTRLVLTAQSFIADLKIRKHHAFRTIYVLT